MASVTATNLSDMRAIVNRAVDERLLDRSDSPFERFKIEQGDTPERTRLSFEQMQAREAPDREQGSTIWHVRNVFLFAFGSTALDARMDELFAASERSADALRAFRYRAR